MFRKSSKTRQLQEQERLAREAAAASPAPPLPSLPSFNPLPTITSFGGEDARPASIGNNQYRNSSYNARQQAQAANFSRPATSTMPSYNSSSSPAYALRSGSAMGSHPSSDPAPPVGGKGANGVHAIDPRAGSITNRGRYSYASNSAQANSNSPRRVRRRKDPTPFNILVVGAKDSGKTSFLSFLRHSLTSRKPLHTTSPERNAPASVSKGSFTSQYVETEMDGERIGVTMWDSAALDKHIIDLQLRELASFVESKFEETFVEEQKVMRTPGAKDTQIHCVIFVLDPLRLDATVTASLASQRVSNDPRGVLSAPGLDEDLDLPVIRALWGKTTVIPIISKADTLTTGHMTFLKRAVWESLKAANLDPLKALELEGEDDSEDEEGDQSAPSEAEEEEEEDPHLPTKYRRNGQPLANGDEPPYLPMSIISPDPYDLPPYVHASNTSSTPGRRFPWGLADPLNPEHCDFLRLRDSLFTDWRSDLRDLVRTRWYEAWRTSRLKNLPGSGKMRVKGGITPTAVVPKDARSLSPRSPTFGNGSAVPRTVRHSVATSNGGEIGMAIGGAPLGTEPSEQRAGKAERMMGIGTYRAVETYQ